MLSLLQRNVLLLKFQNVDPKVSRCWSHGFLIGCWGEPTVFYCTSKKQHTRTFEDKLHQTGKRHIYDYLCVCTTCVVCVYIYVIIYICMYNIYTVCIIPYISRIPSVYPFCGKDLRGIPRWWFPMWAPSSVRWKSAWSPARPRVIFS